MLIPENIIASTIRYISSRHTKRVENVWRSNERVTTAASKVYLTISCYIGVIYTPTHYEARLLGYE
jgi:hypothetical protein